MQIKILILYIIIIISFSCSDKDSKISENNEMYDYDRIIDLITKNHSKDPEKIKTEFFSSLDSWLNGGIPDDDVTLVIVKKVA